MYWESVAASPLGPAPFLQNTSQMDVSVGLNREPDLRMLYDPKMNPMVSPTPPPIRAPILDERSSLRDVHEK